VSVHTVPINHHCLFFRGRDRPGHKVSLDISYSEMEREPAEQDREKEMVVAVEDSGDLEFYDEAHMAVTVCDSSIGIFVKYLM
jgi:hypothetical protein